MRRSLLLMITIALSTHVGAAAQDRGAEADYFRAVATFFSLPPSEIAILSDWAIPAGEIPVVLFVARRAGVSPEALVALRGSGQSWTALAERYRVTAATLHVPVRDDAPAGALSAAYDQYRSTNVREWRSVRLSDAEIVGLVNVRVISQSLGISAEEVLRHTATVSSFVQLHAVLKR